MKKIAVILFLTLLLTEYGYAQNSIIGHVYYLSSGKTPIPGVQINAVGSNGDFSKADGEFTLIFQELTKGEIIRMSLGNAKSGIITNNLGKQLELVNVEILEPFPIPANPYDVPIKIIVCSKGSRDIVAQKYYRIFKTSANIELRKAKEELSVLLREKDEDSLLITALNQKIKNIESGDSITLYKEAFRIASTNKDDASERVLQYLKLLDDGKSVQEAREVLNPQATLREGFKNIQNFDAIIKALEMRINASKAIYDFDDAMKWYDSTLVLIDQSGNTIKYDRLFSDALEYATNNMDLSHSYLLYLKRVEFLKNLNASKNFKVFIESFIKFGRLQRYLGNFDSSLFYYNNALELALENMDSTNAGKIYNNMGLLYKDLGKNDSALYFILKPKDYGWLSLTLSNNAGAILSELGEDSTAVWFFRFTINWITEHKTEERDYFDLSNAYSFLGSSLTELKKIDSALYFHKKALFIARRHKLQHLVSDHLSRYGNTLMIAKKYSEALAAYQEELKIDQSFYNSNHNAIGAAYFNIGSTYLWDGNIDSALKYKELALTNRRLNFEETHPEYKKAAEDYRLVILAFINKYEKQKNFDDVIKMYNKLINYDSKDFRYKWIFLRANSYFKLREYKLARTDYDSVISAYPVYLVYRQRGLCEYFLGDYTMAIFDYLESQKVDSSGNIDTTFYNNIGCAYLKNGRFREAKEAFQQYEALNHDKGRALRNWAMYFALSGDKEKAFYHLIEAIKNGFKDIHWLETDNSFDNLRNDPLYIKAHGLLKKNAL